MADSATVIQGGEITVNATHVTKRFNPLLASRVPFYHLEKLALCRLERFVRPCSGRCDYFPRLLSWDDARYTLVMSNMGAPVARDADERKRTTVPFVERFGAQLDCMRQALSRASVVHHDLQCARTARIIGMHSLNDHVHTIALGTPLAGASSCWSASKAAARSWRCTTLIAAASAAYPARAARAVQAARGFRKQLDNATAASTRPCGRTCARRPSPLAPAAFGPRTSADQVPDLHTTMSQKQNGCTPEFSTTTVALDPAALPRRRAHFF
jgi:hypothetical protein